MHLKLYSLSFCSNSMLKRIESTFLAQKKALIAYQYNVNCIKFRIAY